MRRSKAVSICVKSTLQACRCAHVLRSRLLVIYPRCAQLKREEENSRTSCMKQVEELKHLHDKGHQEVSPRNSVCTMR